jgi:hypothetical protein
VFRILIGSGTRKAEITYKKEEKKKVEKFHGLIASPVALKTSTEASKIYILHFNCKRSDLSGQIWIRIYQKSWILIRSCKKSWIRIQIYKKS